MNWIPSLNTLKKKKKNPNNKKHLYPCRMLLHTSEGFIKCFTESVILKKTKFVNMARVMWARVIWLEYCEHKFLSLASSQIRVSKRTLASNIIERRFASMYQDFNSEPLINCYFHSSSSLFIYFSLSKPFLTSQPHPTPKKCLWRWGPSYKYYLFNIPLLAHLNY